MKALLGARTKMDDDRLDGVVDDVCRRLRRIHHDRRREARASCR